MKNRIGRPVVGDDFRFRELNLKKAIRLVKHGNSFLILGIRKTGKSSFLKQASYLLKQQNPTCICIELDCQTFSSQFDFYKALYKEMPKSLQQRFKKFLGDSKRIPKKLLDGITDVLESVEIGGNKVGFKDKLLTYHKPFEEHITKFFTNTTDTYLFLDELPFFFENIGREDSKITKITQFLTNLKSWRNAGLPMGITGSLNLKHQLDHLGISRKLLAGLNTLELYPFSQEQSLIFIQDLLKEDQFTWWKEAITHKILELLPDHIPFFLQYVYNEIAVHQCRNTQEVEEVFHNYIMSGLLDDFIYQFEERLSYFEAEEEKTAMTILDAIALEEGINLGNLQTRVGHLFRYKVLVKLIDYEFIRQSGKQAYHFTLKIIKNWWLRNRS